MQWVWPNTGERFISGGITEETDFRGDSTAPMSRAFAGAGGWQEKPALCVCLAAAFFFRSMSKTGAFLQKPYPPFWPALKTMFAFSEGKERRGFAREGFPSSRQLPAPPLSIPVFVDNASK